MGNISTYCFPKKQQLKAFLSSQLLTSSAVNTKNTRVFWLYFPQLSFILCLFMSTVKTKYSQVFFTSIPTYQEDRTRLFTVVHRRRRHSGHKLKQERFRSDISKNFSHQGQSSSGTGYSEGLCNQFPILGGFEGVNGYSHERSGLTLELTMLWAGDWTRSPLRCLPTWIIL